jgi:hypothetical protein
MSDIYSPTHDHVFLGAGHETNERRTWGVIILCTCMMVAEIVGGLLSMGLVNPAKSPNLPVPNAKRGSSAWRRA